MDAKTKTTLIKMLGMTGSKHDGEALVAIRKANAILIENNLRWEDLLTSAPQTASRSSYATPPSKRKFNPDAWDNVNREQQHHVNREQQHHDDSDDINKLFEAAYENTQRGSSFYEFIESVHTFWIERNYLTTAQYQAIKRASR